VWCRQAVSLGDFQHKVISTRLKLPAGLTTICCVVTNGLNVSIPLPAVKSLGETVEWNGVFPTEAFKLHRGEAISAS